MSNDPVTEMGKEAVKATVKDAYADAVKPFAQQLGKAGETIGLLGNMFLAPARMLGLKVDDYGKQWEARLKEKLDQQVPKEHQQAPHPAIAGPLLQKAFFKEDEPDLREMFDNLLIKAMCKETVEFAHPAFAEILAEITPDEAKIVKAFIEEGNLPTVSLCNVDKQGGRNYIYRNFSIIGEAAGCEHVDLTPMYLDNLDRLRLVELTEQYTAAPRHYKKVEGHPFIKQMKASQKPGPGLTIELVKGSCRVTALGWRFYQACVLPANKVSSL